MANNKKAKRSLKYYLLLKPIATTLRTLASIFLPPINPHPTTILHIPSRDSKRTIKLHIYTPPSPPKGPSPVLLNFCGSGFVIDGHGSDDHFCRYIAANTEFTVLDVQYRMSPEYPCPAPLEDAEDVLEWVRGQPGVYDVERVGLSGFSAGGNLATGLAANFPGGKWGFGCLVAFYPVVDATRGRGRRRVAPDARGMKLPGWFVGFCTRAYLCDGVEAGDTRVSPLFRDGGEWGVRRVLLVSAARDCLAVEVEELGDRLGTVEGMSVVCERVEGCGHAWDKVAKEGSWGWEEKVRVYGMVVDLLKTV